MTYSRLLPFALLGVLANGVAWPVDVARSGAWWLSASPDEKVGYLAGYIDCAAYDAGQDMGKQSWYSLAPKITAQYSGRPDRMSQPVSAVLKEVVRGESHGPVAGGEGGEHNKEKHGFFDGEYWRRGSDEHVLGFVEGYLDCWRIEGLKGAKFSKPPIGYVAQVSEWFDINGDQPPAVSSARRRMKIADVLWIFRDQ